MAEKKTVRDELREKSEKWATAVREQRIEETMDPYSEKILLLVQGRPPMRGTDAVETYFRSLYAMDVKLDYKPLEVKGAHDGDMAWETGTFELQMPMSGVGSGEYLVVWSKKDGEWETVVDCSTMKTTGVWPIDAVTQTTELIGNLIQGQWADWQDPKEKESTRRYDWQDATRDWQKATTEALNTSLKFNSLWLESLISANPFLGMWRKRDR